MAAVAAVAQVVVQVGCGPSLLFWFRKGDSSQRRFFILAGVLCLVVCANVLVAYLLTPEVYGWKQGALAMRLLGPSGMFFFWPAVNQMKQHQHSAAAVQHANRADGS